MHCIFPMVFTPTLHVHIHNSTRHQNFGINKAMHTVLVLSLLKSTALAILYML